MCAAGWIYSIVFNSCQGNVSSTNVSDLLRILWHWIPWCNHLLDEKVLHFVSFRPAYLFSCFLEWIMQKLSPDRSSFSFSVQLMILHAPTILSLPLLIWKVLNYLLVLHREDFMTSSYQSFFHSITFFRWRKGFLCRHKDIGTVFVFFFFFTLA